MASSSSSSSSGSSSSFDTDDERNLSAGDSAVEQEDETSSGDEEPAALSEDAPVLSHAKQRRQKKKQFKKPETQDSESDQQKPIQNSAELAPSKLPKRQNSVWVGNLSFKTTPEALRRLFAGVGEITRIHMPMKLASGGPGGGGTRKENRGFAYVDFAAEDSKTAAIALSENPLDGRRLLIKDGDDFNGRPTPFGSADAGAEPGSNANLTGHTKTAQKILRAQKQPAGPTLFLGNLGFEATPESIRALFDSHRRAGGPATGEDAGAEAADPWIRKVRLGTFEDSGKCKGWAFVDFTSTEHATSALTNPKNHLLDGRKLVVEYASPDAVRRGGGLAYAKDNKYKGPKSSSEDMRPRKAPVDRVDKPTKRSAGTQDIIADEKIEGTPPKRRRIWDNEDTNGKGYKGGNSMRARAKPGAALAHAKRAPVAIVPSQGQKIIF